MLYRVFPSLPGAGAREAGGPLHVPREHQGAGRHDNPEHYGALYVSRVAVSAVAERIQAFRGQTLVDADLARIGGARLALVAFDDAGLQGVVELDDPAELLARELRPSMIATRRRNVTRAIALRLYTEDAPGFAWWSALEAGWPNVTLFAERTVPKLVPVGEPQLLTVQHPSVRAAAGALGVRLGV